MTYCATHKRVLTPGGYSPPAHAFLPSTWDVLRIDVWRWAVLMAQFCPSQIQFIQLPCDMCDAATLAKHYEHPVVVPHTAQT